MVALQRFECKPNARHGVTAHLDTADCQRTIRPKLPDAYLPLIRLLLAGPRFPAANSGRSEVNARRCNCMKGNGPTLAQPVRFPIRDLNENLAGSSTQWPVRTHKSANFLGSQAPQISSKVRAGQRPHRASPNGQRPRGHYAAWPLLALSRSSR